LSLRVVVYFVTVICYAVFINTVLNFIIDFVSHFSNKTLFRLHQDPD